MRPGAATVQEAFISGGPTPLELVQMATNKYDANDRYLGTLGLANENFAGEAVYLNLFETNLRDGDPMVRAAAIRGLANHGEPRHVGMIVKGLSEPNVLVRMEAARGLQRLHNPEAISPLIEATRERDAKLNRGELEASIRAEAAAALGQYAEHRVLRALIAALDDTDLSVNRAAQRSLKTLTGQDLGIDATVWQRWESETKEPFAARLAYTYPVYSRKLRVYEYIPFIPPPPNEKAAAPTGMPR